LLQELLTGLTAHPIQRIRRPLRGVRGAATEQAIRRDDAHRDRTKQERVLDESRATAVVEQ